MKLINTFEFHKNNPSDSVEQYIKRKRVELSQEIRTSKKIYLDTNYWILLRDARTKGNVDGRIAKLLHLIEGLVKSGQAVCPISTDTFWEIQKQTDSKTLKATAHLIDDLSKGIIIISLPERFDMELIHFVRTKFKHSVYTLDEMVWSKIPYIVGFATPVSKTLSPDINIALQKTFIDQMWSVNLIDMLELQGSKNIMNPPNYDNLSNTLRQNKLKHLNDFKSFKQLFLGELSGILDIYKQRSESLMAYLFERETGIKPSKEDLKESNFSQYFANLIYHAFRLNKIKTDFPSLHVMAKLHAASRWDKNKQINSNDIYDFNHAIDAIPYYDYFLTDHSLRNLVNQKIMGFDAISHCKTISGIDDAISELSQIATTEMNKL
jgi:hypothetical protein